MSRADQILLAAFLEEQFFLLRTSITDAKTRQHYRRAVHSLADMLRRPAVLGDLTDDHIAAVMQFLQITRNQSPATVNSAHKCLTAVWRFARDRGLLTTGPTVAKLRVPIRAPRAWRRDELARLVLAARTSRGAICGMPAASWWLAVLAIEWDTGARAGELLSLRWEWLDWQTGWLHVPAEVRKGRHHDEVYGLGADTLAHLQTLPRQTPLILGWDRDRSRYWQLWKQLLGRAGLPATRYTSTQCLRRSFATYFEIGGGSATDALGHASRDTTRRSYLDPTLLQQRSADRLPFRLLSLDPTPPPPADDPPQVLPFSAAE